MTKKALDRKNRWRSKTVAFRVSPDEWNEIERLVKLSGMSKQEYIMHKLQDKEMKITANPRVVKALKEEMKAITGQLENRVMDENSVAMIRYILEVLG
ncbi:MAG: hypothetical protein R3Y35_13895 [Clostridia bacterium]